MAWLVGHHDRVTQPQDSPAAPGQQPGEATGQPAPSFGGADQGAPGYGTPGQGAPGYGTPGQSPSGYGAPGQGPSGYGTPGQSPSGYGAPAQGPAGYGAPAGQAYPSYPQAGYGPGYPQAGYGQPYHPGYGQYPGYPQPYQGYGQPYKAYAPVTGRKDPALAEWWRRLLARIIDGFILGVIFAPLWIPPWRTFIRSLQNIANEYPSGTLSSSPAARSAIATAESHLFAKMVVIFLGFYVVAFLYDWIQHWQWGQTIGKRALGTRVVRDDGNPSLGAGAAAGRAAIYAFAPLVPLAGSLFALLNELWLTWDPRSQCLHDKAAHTVVVKKDYRGPQPQPGGWQPGGL
jgi:uncharacterized RDD family membrane protein YckC